MKNFLRILRSTKFLLFFNGILLTTTLFVYLESAYEKKLFNSIISKIRKEPNAINKDTFLLKALNITFNLQNKRSDFFDVSQVSSFEFFHSATSDLMTAYGACGSYSIVLARILKANNCKVRIGQMKVNGKFGGHILVETEINGHWIIVDPTYNLFFKDVNSKLLSFNEVSKNWDLYKQQVPSTYNYQYAYQGIRYTNWDKIPIVTPFIRNVLVLFWGEEKVSKLSLRSYFLRSYHILFLLHLILLIPINITLIFRFLRNRKYI